MLTALQVVLGRLSGEDDVVVAIPTAGQSLVGANGLVGHCVNLLPLRVRLDWEASVMAQARATRSLLLDAFEHQDMTYGTLVRKLGHARDQSRLPLTQIQFNLEKLTAGPEMPGLVMRSEPNPKAFTNFDLFFNFIESAEGLRLDCDYNTDLFDVSTVQRWVGHLRMVIAAIIEGDVATVGSVPLISSDDSRALVARLNDSAATDLDLRPVHVLIADQAARTPDATALVWRDETMSFAELDLQSNRLARMIVERVPQTDGRIAIATSRSLNLVVAMLAVMKSGHAYVPLDLQQPASRQDMILSDARVSAVVCDSAESGEPFAGIPTIDLVRDEAAIGALAGDPLPTAAWRSADSAAYVIFTSGSTGRPKGVVITHRSLANLLWSMARRPGFAASDTLLAVTTIAFDIAGAELLLPLLTGGRVVIADRAEVMDGFSLVTRMGSSAANVVQATPSLWRLLLDAGFRSWSGLTMICGGEPLPRDLADLLLEGGGALWNAYGPTETTIWSSLQQIHPGSDPITIGTPLLNTQFHVLDARDQLTAAGVSGELFIGGDGLALGYFGRDDLTAAAFRTISLPGARPQRLYRTGDRARRMADGTIQLIGRTDNQIKLRGFRIELEEIETVLRRCPGVSAVAVALRELPGSDRRLVGYLVPAAGADVPVPTIAAFAAANLPDYMVPKAWIRLSALPLTPNGKLDRRGLRDVEVGEALATPAASLPTSPMQVRLSDIIRDVLHLGPVGIDENLFAIGADSLQLFRIAARLRKAGIGLDVRDLMQYPTIVELAEVADASQSRPDRNVGPSLRAFRRQANVPVGLRQ